MKKILENISQSVEAAVAKVSESPSNTRVLTSLASVVLLLLLMVGITRGCTKVPAGYVGVKVHLLGGSKGVDVESVGVGRYWLTWNEDMFLFPTFEQNYVWTASHLEGRAQDESLVFQTREGLEVGADIGISYHIDSAKVTSIFQKYRQGVDEITHVYLRNYVRDALNEEASKMPVDSVYGEGKVTLVNAVHQKVRDQVLPEGIVIDKIYLIGSFRLPRPVQESLNEKIQAIQNAEKARNLIAEARANAETLVAEAEGIARANLLKASAQAKANRLLAESLSSSFVEYTRIMRWNGELPRISGARGMIIQTQALEAMAEPKN